MFEQVTRRRRAILVGYAIAVAIACFVYVPWHMPTPLHGMQYYYGYDWAWRPPTIVAHVDIGRVILELLGLTLIAGVLWVLVDMRIGNSSKTPDQQEK